MASVDHPGEVVAALQQATHVTLHALAARLDDLDLTASEQNVLAALADTQPRSIGDLVALTGTRPSTLTSVLDRLERKGYLVRDVDYSDRRSVIISLTPAGSRAARAVLAAVASLEQCALAGVSKQQLAGFFAVTLALTEGSR